MRQILKKTIIYYDIKGFPHDKQANNDEKKN